MYKNITIQYLFSSILHTYIKIEPFEFIDFHNYKSLESHKLKQIRQKPSAAIIHIVGSDRHRKTVDLKCLTATCFISEPAYGTYCAPSVLIIFINMMLLKKTESKDPCKPFMYDGQDELQKTFLCFAFLCIPIMLFGKPVYQMLADKKRKVSLSNFVKQRVKRRDQINDRNN